MRIRDNLLVTVGSRAAYMDHAGYIQLPAGSVGEDVLANFASEIVDVWLRTECDTCFDEYIETALENRFPKGGRGFNSFSCPKVGTGPYSYEWGRHPMKNCVDKKERRNQDGRAANSEADSDLHD